MAKPELRPGIYGDEDGRVFAYKGEDSEETVRKHPIYNLHVYHPDGTDDWQMEDSTSIRRYTRLDQDEINTRIENLSLRRTKRNNELIKFLEENKGLGEGSSEDSDSDTSEEED